VDGGGTGYAGNAGALPPFPSEIMVFSVGAQGFVVEFHVETDDGRKEHPQVLV